MSEDSVSFLFLLLLPHHLACTFFTHESCCMGQWTHNKEFVLPLVHFSTSTQVSTLTLHLLYTYLHYKRKVWCCVEACDLWGSEFRSHFWTQSVCDAGRISPDTLVSSPTTCIVPNRWRWMHFSTKPTNSSKWSNSSQILPFSCFFILFILSGFSSFFL